MNKCLLILACFFSSLSAYATPPSASEVFQVQVHPVDANNFSVNWTIKPGFFLYQDRINIQEEKNANVQLAKLQLPQAVIKTDKQGKQLNIYRDHLSLTLSVLGKEPGETLLALHYQGCADDGFCYPPVDKQIKLSIDESLGINGVSLEQINTATQVTTPSSSPTTYNTIFTDHQWPMILLIFFGFGLLLSFTPCILPMVPVLSGIIIGHGKDVNTKSAFFLSLSYVLSMSLTYALVGALVAAIGSNLQIVMQSPWAISLFSLVFVLLALSMFGFYEFKLPDAWQSKIAGTSQKQMTGHYLGAAIMGCLSTLILSPCVTAPLIGVLTYIAQTGNMALGALTLFVMGLGMGTPLLLIGTSAGRWLPSAGKWMNGVKAFFGILLLAVAIYLMSRILPSLSIMLLWSSLFVFTGLYCGALNKSTDSLEQFLQGMGIMLLCYGLLILIGASMGHVNPIKPLERTDAEYTSTAKIPVFNTLSGIDQSLAQSSGKPVMLDFYADWCSSCKVIAATTFKVPEVSKALDQFNIIKVDLTKNDANTQELMKHFNVVAPPTFIFFNKEGKELTDLRVIGEISANEFLGILHKQLDKPTQ